MKIKILHAALITLWLLSACSPQNLQSKDNATLSAADPYPATAPVCQDCQTNQADALNRQPTATPPPMRFVLPTPGAEPVSAWRPPLYPVPWAIGPYDHFYFTRPIAANEVNWPLADYRYGGIFFSPDIVHTGIDIPAEEGTIVIASGPGTVTWAGWGLYHGIPQREDDPYGLAVVIRHDFGYQGYPLYTVYAHLSQVDVTVGQWLDTGTRLGLVGNTGFSTGPHLHFEVRVGRDSFFETYNPELWLAPPQGWGVLVGKVLDTSRRRLERHPIEITSKATGRTWYSKTYSGEPARGDPYYRENFVLSDLPAGEYTVGIPYGAFLRTLDITIHPGQITYFSFRGFNGYSTELPSIPGAGAIIPQP